MEIKVIGQNSTQLRLMKYADCWQKPEFSKTFFNVLLDARSGMGKTLFGRFYKFVGSLKNLANPKSTILM